MVNIDVRDSVEGRGNDRVKSDKAGLETRSHRFRFQGFLVDKSTKMNKRTAHKKSILPNN